ncbi:hypothetical protein D3C72_1243270 [compost metagenome]
MPQPGQHGGRKHRLHVGGDRVVVVQAHQLAGGRGLVQAVVGHAHEVFLVHRRVFADELARDAAVLCHHEQAGGVDVQPPARRQAAQLLRAEEEARVVFRPAVLRREQRDRRLVPVLGLPAHVADGLVDEDRDLVRLLPLGGLVDLDAVVGRDLHAHLGGLAVDAHPALRDPVVRLAARAQAEFGHAFVEAHGRVGGGGGLGHGGANPSKCALRVSGRLPSAACPVGPGTLDRCVAPVLS